MGADVNWLSRSMTQTGRIGSSRPQNRPLNEPFRPVCECYDRFRPVCAAHRAGGISNQEARVSPDPPCVAPPERPVELSEEPLPDILTCRLKPPEWEPPSNDETSAALAAPPARPKTSAPAAKMAQTFLSIDLNASVHAPGALAGFGPATVGIGAPGMDVPGMDAAGAAGEGWLGWGVCAAWSCTPWTGSAETGCDGCAACGDCGVDDGMTGCRIARLHGDRRLIRGVAHRLLELADGGGLPRGGVVHLRG